MTPLSGRRIVVAGAGAIGSVLALRLAEAGAAVVLADPAALGANASGVAAGMLAPAFEAVLDAASAGHFPLLRAARDLWPDIEARAARLGGRIDRSGALWAGEAAGLDVMQARLAQAGAAAERLGTAAAERLSPGLRAPSGGVFTPEDWTLDPLAMLTALQGAFEEAGGRMRPAAVQAWNGRAARLSDGGAVEADALVLATGIAAEGLADPPPELMALAPIKGQIVRFAAAAPQGGPVVRGEGVYVVPRPGGPVAGATMEAGVHDIRVEPAAAARLRAAAGRLFPDLADAPAAGAAGVRAATPDGLPLVGPSRTGGVVLAVGARRNGWLLAPLIAEAVLDRLIGGEGGPYGRLFDPARF